jgi:undecaprenyl phosphate N,N'-diacetylbacillosamine 1-phosphate transferase
VSAGGAFAKRLVDLLVSGFFIVLLSPVFLAIALIIKATSPGPVLFRQRRMGRDGKPFAICKFRSMITNAPDLRNPDGSAYTGEDDPRVTKIGRFLRKTSLDELPQLCNVFKGDMSLVGPRPDQVDQIRYYTAEEKRKLLVKPGITGLAQINGRNNIPWAERKRFDIEYVDRQSFLFDVGILFKTVPYVLLRKGVNEQTNPEDRGDQR